MGPILFSKHARVRCAQRGIDESLIFMVLAYGRAEYARQGQRLCAKGQSGQGLQIALVFLKKEVCPLIKSDPDAVLIYSNTPMGRSSGFRAPLFAGSVGFWQSKKVLWPLQLAALVLTVLLAEGCSTTAQEPVMKLCQSADHCAGGPTRIVQQAIDTIVNANFPERAGVYKAMMWKDRGELVAATGLGVSIHISTSLYMALTWDQLVAVMAHELAHQQANHVLIDIGVSSAIWIVDKATWFITPWMILSPVDGLIDSAFERNLEIAADLLAIEYLKKAGYTKEDYLALLNWIKTEVDGGGGCRVLCDHPHIDDRIKAVREGRNVLYQDTSRAVDQIAD